MAERSVTVPRPGAFAAWHILLIGLLGALTWGIGLPVAAAERPEHEVKAAFLYNFGKYVRWPKSAPAPDTPFVIALLGADPFGAALDEIVRGNRIDDRPVTVKRVSKVSELGACEVLFIGASEDARLEKILAELPKAPILTVGDMPRFVERGGMIGLVAANRRVQFEVNADAAERAGLVLGSQLLRLARAVVDPKAR
ncbi:MAG: DUF4154 domain-containing protein [Betaproteobacteria bacterium]|nr:DUF4154 domain-containing protein [Betaproteobacteria bacterium]